MSKSKAQAETMSGVDFPVEMFDELEAYISTLDDKQGSLIHVLHKAQNIFGYLPREVQLHIARKLDIPGAKVFGVVSFYSYFTQTPRGKHTISICMGTACFVKDADKILKKFNTALNVKTGDTTSDNLFTLRDVRCIGACGLAPIILVDDKVYGHVTVDDVDKIIAEYREDD